MCVLRVEYHVGCVPCRQAGMHKSRLASTEIHSSCVCFILNQLPQNEMFDEGSTISQSHSDTQRRLSHQSITYRHASQQIAVGLTSPCTFHCNRQKAMGDVPRDGVPHHVTKSAFWNACDPPLPKTRHIALQAKHISDSDETTIPHVHECTPMSRPT